MSQIKIDKKSKKTVDSCLQEIETTIEREFHTLYNIQDYGGGIAAKNYLKKFLKNIEDSVTNMGPEMPNNQEILKGNPKELEKMRKRRAIYLNETARILDLFHQFYYNGRIQEIENLKTRVLVDPNIMFPPINYS